MRHPFYHRGANWQLAPHLTAEGRGGDKFLSLSAVSAASVVNGVVPGALALQFSLGQEPLGCARGADLV